MTFLLSSYHIWNQIVSSTSYILRARYFVFHPLIWTWENDGGREKDQPAKMLSVRIAWALFSLLNDAKHPGSMFTLLMCVCGGCGGAGRLYPFSWGLGYPSVLFSNSACRFEPAFLSDHFSSLFPSSISSQQPFPLFLYQKRKR